MFIDGDFITDTLCKYHCYPTCHPAQIGLERVYGCTHMAWPQNKDRDFVPIVKCNGKIKNCEIPIKFLKRTISGKKRKITGLEKKIKEEKQKLKEYEQFMKGITRRST